MTKVCKIDNNCHPELVSESNAYRFRNKFGMTKMCKINNNRHSELVSESKNVKTLQIVHCDIKRMAFTLSEVLITLVVIGIVAAITVPTLYANYQEKALRSALTKNYSVFKQVFDQYYIRNGERFDVSDYSGARFLKDLFKKELNVMKDCGNDGRGKQPCLEDTVANTYKTYNGNSINHNMFDDGHIVLNDGSYLMWENSGTTNMIISVDVNGPSKKPNRLGRDLFMFQILKDGTIKPMGEKGTSYSKERYCDNTSSDGLNGAGCTTKVLGKNKST